MKKTVTLTGTILKIDIRTTQPTTRTELRYSTLAGRRVPTEITPRERQYAVLKFRSERTRVVHRLIAWDVDDLSKRPIAWANPGDQVQITGTPEVVTLTNGDGSTFDLHQIVLTGYKVLRKQPRARVRDEGRSPPHPRRLPGPRAGVGGTFLRAGGAGPAGDPPRLSRLGTGGSHGGGAELQ